MGIYVQLSKATTVSAKLLFPYIYEKLKTASRRKTLPGETQGISDNRYDTITSNK